MENQLAILEESLEQKIRVLREIEQYNQQQEATFTAETVDMSQFDAAVEEKGRLIEKLNALDDGFETLYEKAAAQLQGNREKYAEQIRRLQDLIGQVTELSTSIQAQEARNKTLIEQYFVKERTNISQRRKNSAAAYSFYKSMSSLSAPGSGNAFDDKK